MKKYEFRHSQIKSEAGNVYVSGLGFFNISQSHITILGIRQMSNLLVTCTMLYFILQNLFILPVTYLVYLFSPNVSINFYTGLIISTPFGKTIILILSNIASLGCCAALTALFYKRCFLKARILKRPQAGVTSIAAPIIIAMGLLGIVISSGLSRLLAMLGLVFETSVTSPPTSVYAFILFLAFVLIEELFFRGIILTPLRRFGDGFAIITSSLIFGLWSSSVSDFLFSFIIAIPLSYFVIRSGSVYTAMISRFSLETTLFVLKLSSERLERSLAMVIFLLTVILSIIFALYAFVTYIKTDKKAFFLFPPRDKLKLSFKILTSVCSILFLFYIGFFVVRVVSNLEIIG